MRKLLSLLGAVMLSATTASAVVACGNAAYINGSDNGNAKIRDTKYDLYRLKAAIVARAKSLVAEDAYKFNDESAKSYVMNNLLLGALEPSGNNKVDREYINDFYSDFINDKSLANVQGINLKGSVEEPGEVINYLKQTAIEVISKKIYPDNPLIVESAIKTILEALGVDINGSNKNFAETLNTYLGAITQVSTKVAVEGIPNGLKMINSQDATLLSVISTVWSTLKDATKIGDSLVKLIDGINQSANATEVGKATVGNAADTLMPILDRILVNQYGDDDKDKNTMASDIMQLISGLGYYLSFVDHNNDSSSSVVDRLADSKDKLLNTSVFYKESEDKKSTVLNIVPVLNDLAYYLGSNSNEDRILEFAQMMFLEVDDKGITLNKFGKALFEGLDKGLGGSLLRLVDSLLDKPIDAKEAEDIFLSILVNTTDDSKYGKTIEYQTSDIKTILAALFSDKSKKPFDYIYTDWTSLGKIGDSDLGKDKIPNNEDVQALFLNDSNGRTLGNGKYSLETLLKNAPIYKLLYLAGAKGYSKAEMSANGGILPNWGGAYTQSSISDLAKEVDTIFALKSETSKDDDIKNDYFDFSNLKELVSRIFVKNGDGPAVLDQLIPALKSSEGKRAFAKSIGYDLTNDNIVAKDSFMGQLIKTLAPGIVPTANGGNSYSNEKDLTDSALAKTDTLHLFMSSISTFLQNMLKPTNYDYWKSKVLMNNEYDNFGINKQLDFDSDVWFYADKKDRPGNNKGYSFGFTYNGDKNNQHETDIRNVNEITLVIKFDLSNMPSLINMTKANQKANNHRYLFTLKRVDNKFDFVSFSKETM